MTSPLDNLCGQDRPLAPEPPDAQEYAGLMRSGLARLQDAAGLPPAGRLAIHPQVARCG